MNHISNVNHRNSRLYFQSCIKKGLLQTSVPCTPIYERDKKEDAPRKDSQLSTEMHIASEKGRDHPAQSITTTPPLGDIKQLSLAEGPIHTNSVEFKTSKVDCYPQTRLAGHREYLMQRLQETQYTISGPQLFKEIRARGYRGSLSNLQYFMTIIRKNKCPPQVRLAWHRGYMIKRLEETRDTISGPQLFKEIQAKGYRGAVRSVTNFLSILRKNRCLPEARLAFHEDYLTERIEKAEPQYVAASALFTEIQARGYRGSFANLKRKITAIRRGLFLKQIPAKGYQRSIEVVQNFITANQKNKCLLKNGLGFHKRYLTARIEEEEVGPNQIPRLQLLKEIQARGYRGSRSAMERFVGVIRKKTHPPESYLCFHEKYLIKRIEGALPNRIPTAELFEEVRSKGYRGSYSYLKGFVYRTRNHKLCTHGMF